MTKTLQITRIREFSDETIGEFKLTDEQGNTLSKGYTLEPAGPDTTEANTDRRIPEGEYTAIWEWSGMSGNKYFDNQLPLIYNDLVSKSRKIRIHIGNYGKDTLGCILLGKNWSGKSYISNSKDAILDCLNHVKNEKFNITIINDIDNKL